MHRQQTKRARRTGLTGSALTGRRTGARPWHAGEVCQPLDYSRTLNAAIIRQSALKPEDRSLTLSRQDLHLQLRSRQTRRLVVFVIDTSDSMDEGPATRMTAALGAIVSLAAKAYLNRDQVCLITFRDRDAELVVPPTASVTRVRQQLQRLPVGGATPLAAGLQKARQVIIQARAKTQTMEPLMVLITDGQASMSTKPGIDPADEALAVAALLCREKVPTLLIDTLPAHHQQRFTPHLAKALGTTSQTIHRLQTGQVLKLIEDSEIMRRL